MPSYSYSARAQDGSLQQGRVDAVSLQAARDALVAMSLEPEEIHEETMAGRAPGPDAQTLTFSGGGAQETTPSLEASPLQSSGSASQYVPLLDTLRIYAGWLLALLLLTFAFGAYQTASGELPFRIPFVESFLLSPLLLEVAFASYLFLLVTSIQRALRGSAALGLLLSGIGFLLFIVYRMNIE